MCRNSFLITSRQRKSERILPVAVHPRLTRAHQEPPSFKTRILEILAPAQRKIKRWLKQEGCCSAGKSE
jgi:hypothetical protein